MQVEEHTTRVSDAQMIVQYPWLASISIFRVPPSMRHTDVVCSYDFWSFEVCKELGPNVMHVVFTDSHAQTDAEIKELVAQIEHRCEQAMECARRERVAGATIGLVVRESNTPPEFTRLLLARLTTRAQELPIGHIMLSSKSSVTIDTPRFVADTLRAFCVANRECIENVVVTDRHVPFGDSVPGHRGKDWSDAFTKFANGIASCRRMCRVRLGHIPVFIDDYNSTIEDDLAEKITSAMPCETNRCASVYVCRLRGLWQNTSSAVNGDGKKRTR
jgi:hypothetical protein